MPHYQEIIDFWFQESVKKKWWDKDPEFDDLVRTKFVPLYEQACRCELFQWRATSEGRLAEIILLDQFPRNMFRDAPRSFASDPLALALAQEGIANGADKQLASDEKAFFYMPFMHSESLRIHQTAVILFDQPGLEKNFEFEIRHKQIIERFGRYPHRNDILGRPSSSEEIEFLKLPGSGF